MREGNFSSLPERNPQTQAAHRREVLWQITVPLVIGVLLILALAVGTVLSSYSFASQAANISLIWLILPALLFIFIFLILLAGITYGIIRLIGILPPYAAYVQNLFVLVNGKVRQISDAAVEPVLKTAGAWAGLGALFGKRTSAHK
jgi:hypothetical protein